MIFFKLPDLGEGLQEAEIVEWHVGVGDKVENEQILVAVETAKAVVELPSPQDGRIVKLYGKVGDFLRVGDPLVEYESTHTHPNNTGTVVGEVEEGRSVIREPASAMSSALSVSVRVTPAVRALASRYSVDLSMVSPSGPEATITAADVQRVAGILAEVGPLEPLRGVRRAMARSMTQAHSEVVSVTLNDDAEIDRWHPTDDVSIRLIRAIVVGCKAEPSLNAWYDSHAVGRRVLEKIHLGIAVDTEEGLFVPVMRDVGNRGADDLRVGLEKIKKAAKARSIPPEDMRGYTITLSNFGTIAGRYANPIVVPPTVAILGAGRIRHGIVAGNGGAEIRRILPLSLTFDHRAVTGGEAARFLACVLQNLALQD